MDSATEHFTLYDADLNLIDANTRTLETLAWNKEDVIGRNVVDLFPDCVVSGRLQRYRKVIETGEPFDEEVGTYSGEDGLGKAVLRVFTAGGGIGITSADITEQTKAEAALRESQARLNAFFAEAPAGLVILDHDLRYIKINETLARYHGLTAEDHVGRPLHDVSPLVAESLSHIFRQVLKTGEPVLNLEYEGEMPGSPPIKTVNITSIFPVLGADGTPQAVGAISSDISDKKRAEAALHESEELRRLFMDLASDNFALFDSDLNLLSANAAALVYLGGSLEDAVGKQLLELLPDFAGSERYQRYLEVARTGRRYDSEVTIRRKDGETVHCAISAFRAGEGIGVISRDITARKQAEAALRESEELRKRFMDSAGATFALFDAELNFLDINAASLNRFGLKREDVIGKNLADVSTNAVSSGRYDRYLNIIETGEPIRLEVVSSAAHEGRHRVMDMRVFPVADGLVVISDDITDRKAAEEALRESEELRRLFMDSSSATFALFDSELNFLDLNAAGLERFGLAKEDVIGRNLAEISPDAAKTRRFDRYFEVMRTGKHLHLESVAHESRKGQHSVMDMRLFPVADGLGVIAEDITEQNTAEAARRESDENLNLFFESAKDDFALFDHDMNLLHANDSSLTAMGSSRETAIGSHLLDIAPQFATTDRYAAYLRVMETGEPYEAEVIMVSPTGEKRIKSHYAFPAGDGVGLVIRDVTQQKLSDAALRRSDETLRTVVDNAPILLWAVDSDRINTVLMGRSFKTLNINPKERLGQVNGERRFNPPEMEKRLEAALNGEDQIYSVSVEGRDFETRLVPLRDSDGATEGAIGVSVDVTEQKRAERDLASLNQHLEELVAERTTELRAAQDELIASERLAAVGHVTATVAHELRIPLATIRTSIFSLDMKVADRVHGTGEIFQRIERNVVRCDRIISELLDYSGSREPQIATVDLNQCIATWVDDYEASKSGRLRLAISGNNAKVRVDQDRLHQVIVNLLDNASQAQEAGGDAKIGVRTGVEDGRFIVEVADDGPGIPDNVLPRIFEPLFSTKAFGVGLGLPLVKKIIDQHNGDIEVTTGVGDGTTFRISLPLAQSSEAAA